MDWLQIATTIALFITTGLAGGITVRFGELALGGEYSLVIGFITVIVVVSVFVGAGAGQLLNNPYW